MDMQQMRAESILSAQRLIEKLKARGETVTFAESCTAGMLSSVFCSVAGASEVFDGALTGYANRIKSRFLGVSDQILSSVGAVSKECAMEMAAGASAMFEAELSLSVTGIAGPGGGTPEKPVGTVYIGCFYKGKGRVTRNLFEGDRQEVRMQSVLKALEMGLEALAPKMG